MREVNECEQRQPLEVLIFPNNINSTEWADTISYMMDKTRLSFKDIYELFNMKELGIELRRI